MRTTPVLPVAILTFLTCALPAIAEPAVRVAVVGFTGGVAPETLQSVATQLRQSLSSAANPAELVVVSRDEMARVYQARGAGCHPEDTGCIVDASGAWGARLFVRGTVSYGADGFSISAGIDSVRGVHVADDSVSAETYLDVQQVLPQLARSLVERERAFRATMPKAPAGVVVASAAAPTPASTESEPEVCRNVWLMGVGVARGGDLIISDEGVEWRSKFGLAKIWSAKWQNIKRFDTTPFMLVSPGITIYPSNEWDFLGMYFEDSAQQHRCLSALQRRRP